MDVGLFVPQPDATYFKVSFCDNYERLKCVYVRASLNTLFSS